jgi:hypothetical protein
MTLGSTSMDIIDALGTALSGDPITSHTPIYVVSPVAKNVLGYCEILSEWLRPRATGGHMQSPHIVGLFCPYSRSLLTQCATVMQSHVGIHQHFAPESPFIHEKLQQSGRLQIVSDVHALRSAYLEPCIVLAGHPSLRLGPGVYVWGGGVGGGRT